MDTYWYEKELSEGKDYTVLAVNYLHDGRLRIAVEKNGKIEEFADYIDRYESVKSAEQKILQQVLNQLNQ